jgi:transcriptional regulator with XRE-family HTH domain
MIGARLKEARLAQNLKLDEISEKTHIRLKYLNALENSQFEKLPNPVIARGFIQILADLLKIDREPLLKDFDEQYSPSRRDFSAQVMSESPMQPKRPMIISSSEEGSAVNTRNEKIESSYSPSVIRKKKFRQYALIAVGIFLIFYSIQKYFENAFGNFNVQTDRQPRVVTLTSVVTPEAIENQKMVKGVLITIKAVDNTWVRVVKDGVLVAYGPIEKDEERTYEAKQYIKLKVGSGKKIYVFESGKPRGYFAEEENAVEKTYLPPEDLVAGTGVSKNTDDKAVNTSGELPPIF